MMDRWVDGWTDRQIIRGWVKGKTEIWYSDRAK